MKNLLTLLVIMFLFTGYSYCNKKESLINKVENSLQLAREQSLAMARSLSNTDGKFPKSIDKNGQLESCNSSWWVSGFFPGELWYLYEHFKDDSLKYWASEYTDRVSDQQYTTGNHDVGFMIFCSFGNGYRILKDENYLPVIRNAAKSLSTRFNPLIGCTRSWNRSPWNNKWQYAVIIDNMMNLELLEWASMKFNDPHFAEIAESHANTTMKNHFRPDGSSYHVVSYDTITGQPEKKNTAQGYSDESAWSRGQAWGLYGFTMMYRYTGKIDYLKQAIKIADFVIHNPNLPKDKIPYWDFNAPDIPTAKRDVSAGAILCSALLELQGYVSKNKSKEFLKVAEEQLNSMCSDTYLAQKGTNANFLLKHGVGNIPGGSEIDVPLTYADYYFVEAMTRYLRYMKKEPIIDDYTFMKNKVK
jgi:unsaturated chondroitin disaccharide hydrolase